MTTSFRTEKKPYRFFAIATVIYAFGVVGFSTWSYTAQHQLTQNRADQEGAANNAFVKKLMLRNTAESVFLLLMAVPLVFLYNRGRHAVAKDLEQLNDLLQKELELQKIREEELKDAIRDLERFNAVSVGRESRIIELKTEVNNLLVDLNRNDLYKIGKND